MTIICNSNIRFHQDVVAADGRIQVLEHNHKASTSPQEVPDWVRESKEFEFGIRGYTTPAPDSTTYPPAITEVTVVQPATAAPEHNKA